MAARKKRDPFRGLDLETGEPDRLRKAGFPDTLAVWQAAGDGSVEPLAGLVERSGIPAERLQTVLAGAGRRALRPSPAELLARHWLDAAVVAGVLLLAWLGWRPTHPATPRHLRAREAVAAFRVMDTAWLADTVAGAPADAVRTRGKAQGHVLLRALAPGEPLTAAHLGPRLSPGAMAGRSVLAMAARPVPKAAGPRPGAPIGLVLAPRAAGEPAVVIRDALLLAATPRDSALDLLVALRAADFAAAAALLGRADVHVVAAAP